MLINWKLKELQVKLVYYGPALSGKTTNLEHVHTRVPSPQRSELVSVKTREDRTLFFDFMQMELNEIKGLKPKFKLYTVPGQVYYAATRKLVLRDVDGLVFVADSSVQRLAANRRALEGMWDNLKSMGRSPEDLPFVLQCNKQDLPDAVDHELLGRFLNVTNAPVIPAVALEGQGVIETLKNLINQVISRL
ncbi:MAG TPA: ADP-ribosylation factor-like protein [Anaerolineae bacterium]|nr:ADP-ribosylation factor-like protein [Anaerolineae bacterium]